MKTRITIIIGIMLIAMPVSALPILSSAGQINSTGPGSAVGSFGLTGTIWEYGLLAESNAGDFLFGSSMSSFGTDGLLLSYNYTAAAAMNTVSARVFLDAEIDEGFNTWYNEQGEILGSAGSGVSWEIDEPGFVFGDIYDNFYYNTLDNSIFNGDPNLVEDVSLAMAFDFGNLVAGDQILLQILIAESQMDLADWGMALHQWDDDNGPGGDNLYMAGRYSVITTPPPATVPEPSTIGLLALGISCIGLASRKRRK